jgi:hypothetical protein
MIVKGIKNDIINNLFFILKNIKKPLIIDTINF